jgi:hypothetical protein
MTKKEKLNASLEGLFSKSESVAAVIEAEPELPPSPPAPPVVTTPESAAPVAVVPEISPVPAPELLAPAVEEAKPAPPAKSEPTPAAKTVKPSAAVVNERQLVVFSGR